MCVQCDGRCDVRRLEINFPSPNHMEILKGTLFKFGISALNPARHSLPKAFSVSNTSLLSSMKLTFECSSSKCDHSVHTTTTKWPRHEPHGLLFWMRTIRAISTAFWEQKALAAERSWSLFSETQSSCHRWDQKAFGCFSELCLDRCPLVSAWKMEHICRSSTCHQGSTPQKNPLYLSKMFTSPWWETNPSFMNRHDLQGSPSKWQLRNFNQTRIELTFACCVARTAMKSVPADKSLVSLASLWWCSADCTYFLLKQRPTPRSGRCHITLQIVLLHNEHVLKAKTSGFHDFAEMWCSPNSKKTSPRSHVWPQDTITNISIPNVWILSSFWAWSGLPILVFAFELQANKRVIRSAPCLSVADVFELDQFYLHVMCPVVHLTQILQLTATFVKWSWKHERHRSPVWTGHVLLTAARKRQLERMGPFPKVSSHRSRVGGDGVRIRWRSEHNVWML